MLCHIVHYHSLYTARSLALLLVAVATGLVGGQQDCSQYGE